MTYSLLPHNCGFGAESVVKPAYELNIPIVSVSGRADINPVAEISASNVIVESLKPAEDGTASFVIRAYECEGTAAKACIRLNVPFEKAVLTNMLEDEKEALSVSGGCIDLSFRPFEIKTIKVVR
jgi:alpha-mannosidase